MGDLPTGGLMAQVSRLGPKIGGHLALLCIHRVNRVIARNDYTVSRKKLCKLIFFVRTLSNLDRL